MMTSASPLSDQWVSQWCQSIWRKLMIHVLESFPLLVLLQGQTAWINVSLPFWSLPSQFHCCQVPHRPTCSNHMRTLFAQIEAASFVRFVNNLSLCLHFTACILLGHAKETGLFSFGCRKHRPFSKACVHRLWCVHAVYHCPCAEDLFLSVDSNGYSKNKPQIFDGLYKPFMVIRGMVYYWYTNITFYLRGRNPNG